MLRPPAGAADGATGPRSSGCCSNSESLGRHSGLRCRHAFITSSRYGNLEVRSGGNWISTRSSVIACILRR